MQSRSARKTGLHKYGAWIALWAGICLLGPPACLAADAGQRDKGGGAAAEGEVAAAPFGQVIRIPLPLDGKAVVRVRRSVRQALDKARTQGSRPVLIFEFDAARGGAEASQGTSFGDAYELADFLSGEELNAATTIAYLPQSIRGHAVLLALACDQIIMAEGATIGAAGAEEKVVGPTVESAYREIAGRRRTLPEELALAMLHPRADVLMVHTEASTEYVTPAELAELRKRHTIQSQDVVVRQGEPAQFSAAELRRWGFVKRLAASRLEVVRALGLPAQAVRGGPVARRAVAGGPRRCERPDRRPAGRSDRTIDRRRNAAPRGELHLLADRQPRGDRLRPPGRVPRPGTRSLGGPHRGLYLRARPRAGRPGGHGLRPDRHASAGDPRRPGLAANVRRRNPPRRPDRPRKTRPQKTPLLVALGGDDPVGPRRLPLHPAGRRSISSATTNSPPNRPNSNSKASRIPGSRAIASPRPGRSFASSATAPAISTSPITPSKTLPSSENSTTWKTR